MFDKKLKRQLQLRKKVVEVREGMREKLLASKRKRVLQNRKLKREMDKMFQRKRSALEKQLQVYD